MKKTYIACEEYHGLQISTIRMFHNEEEARTYAKKVGSSMKGFTSFYVRKPKKLSWTGCRIYEVFTNKKPRLIKV